MDRKRPYLKEWRKKRGYTQGRVAGMLLNIGEETLPSTEASLSRLENGKQPYSEPVINALAEIYRCTPADLFNVNPLKEGEVVDFMGVLTKLDSEQQQKAKAVIDAMFGDEQSA